MAQIQDIDVLDMETSRALGNLRDVARDLQASAGRETEITDQVLPDGVEVPIRHRMQRAVRAYPSGVRGAVTTGRIEEIRARQYARSEVVVLKAVGYGADITIDLLLRAT